jgi:hypothetical protein
VGLGEGVPVRFPDRHNDHEVKLVEAIGEMTVAVRGHVK